MNRVDVDPMDYVDDAYFVKTYMGCYSGNHDDHNTVCCFTNETELLKF